MKKINAVVIDNKHAHNHTVLVRTESSKYNTFFRKVVPKHKMLLVHNPSGEILKINQRVVLVECPPISKKKKHTIIGDNRNER
jgi:ribosomal protein S17